MPKKAKRLRVKGQKEASQAVPEYVSDDEKLYGNYDEPDAESSEYIHDDIDQFHMNRNEILLDKGYKEDDHYGIKEDQEEEVLELDSEESDDEEIRALKSQLRRVRTLQRQRDTGSDLEDQSEEEEDEPEIKTWGHKRSKYYGDDEVDVRELMEDEAAEAALEEQEALRLQRQMAEQLEDADFGLDIFQPTPDTTKTEETSEKIVKDLSKLSKKEKLKLLKTESPELLTLIEEFKDKMTEVKQRLNPLRQFVISRNLAGPAVDYVHTKLKLVLNYCTNISFYLMLKAKQAPVHNHPVIKRLLQYRNILKQMEPLDAQLNEEIDDILQKLSTGEEIDLTPPPVTVEQPKTGVTRKRKSAPTGSKANKKKLSELVSDSGEDSDDLYEDIGATRTKAAAGKKADGQYETKDEQEALEYYEMMKGGRPDQQEADGSGEEGEQLGDDGGDYEEDWGEEGMDEKRPITYQIEKNRGLTATKKKELRNPRVKHRMKFKKAKVRRKGQYREPRTEVQKYGGEISGIRAAIKRGVKLK